MQLVIINPPRAFPHRKEYQITKRVMDIILSILILPVALPVMAICALAIALDSRGPIIFAQERIGKGGRRFKMYKFRTMEHNLDDAMHRVFMKAFVNGKIASQGGHGRPYKPVQDSQITRVGRILRKTSLDELPQIINVLKGEMSWIGPRPNVPWEVEEYQYWHQERLEVLPGITGLAQVNGRSCIAFDAIVDYDIEYVMRQSLWLDIQILWWTFKSVLQGGGAG